MNKRAALLATCCLLLMAAWVALLAAIPDWLAFTLTGAIFVILSWFGFYKLWSIK